MTAGFDRVEVFSTTMARDRHRVGEVITDYLHQHSDLEVVDKAVRLSSDAEFHCLSIVLFLRSLAGEVRNVADSMLERRAERRTARKRRRSKLGPTVR